MTHVVVLLAAALVVTQAAAATFDEQVIGLVNAIGGVAGGLLAALDKHRLIARVDRLDVAYEKIFNKLFGQKQEEYSSLAETSFEGYVKHHALERRVRTRGVGATTF